MPERHPLGLRPRPRHRDGRRSAIACTSTGRSPTTAIAAARAGLGPAGERAWLNLRVYDITGRLFDGTNAHSYFDHRVERHERQWFFAIDKPTSTACVEVGLRSEEGYFVKIARSGRVEFPAQRAGRAAASSG